MKLIKHAENVYEIEGFLDKELIDALLLKCIQNIDWNMIYPGSTIKNMGDELLIKMEHVYKKIETFFTDIESITHSFDLRRLTNAEFMFPHVDGGNPDDPKK